MNHIQNSFSDLFMLHRLKILYSKIEANVHCKGRLKADKVYSMTAEPSQSNWGQSIEIMVGQIGFVSILIELRDGPFLHGTWRDWKRHFVRLNVHRVAVKYLDDVFHPYSQLQGLNKMKMFSLRDQIFSCV